MAHVSFVLASINATAVAPIIGEALVLDAPKSMVAAQLISTDVSVADSTLEGSLDGVNFFGMRTLAGQQVYTTSVDNPIIAVRATLDGFSANGPNPSITVLVAVA